VVNTSELSLEECVDKVVGLLVQRGVVELDVVKIPVLEAAVDCSG
jgi:hypothetical protein